MKTNTILLITSVISTAIAILCYREVINARDHHTKLFDNLTDVCNENVHLKNELEALKEEL